MCVWEGGGGPGGACIECFHRAMNTILNCQLGLYSSISGDGKNLPKFGAVYIRKQWKLKV